MRILRGNNSEMVVPGNAKVAVTLRVTSRRTIDILSATSGLLSVYRPTSPAPHSESEGYFDGSAIHVATFMVMHGATYVTGKDGAVRGSLTPHTG
jgi:hypothetical protein